MALDFEALDVKIALDFRAFVLQSCTLYTVKKNEALNRRPHFVSRIPLIPFELSLLIQSALSFVMKLPVGLPSKWTDALAVYTSHTVMQAYSNLRKTFSSLKEGFLLQKWCMEIVVGFTPRQGLLH